MDVCNTFYDASILIPIPLMGLSFPSSWLCQGQPVCSENLRPRFVYNLDSCTGEFLTECIVCTVSSVTTSF